MFSQISSTVVNRLAFLRTTDFLQHIENEAFLECLAAAMEERTFEENQAILHKGDRERLIFFIVEGKVKIHVDDIKMAELSQGAHFGDINLFNSQPASATVTTIEASRCLILHQSKLQAALQKHAESKAELVASLYQRQQKVQTSAFQQNALQNWYTRIQNPSWAY